MSDLVLLEPPDPCAIDNVGVKANNMEKINNRYEVRLIFMHLPKYFRFIESKNNCCMQLLRFILQDTH